MFVRKSCSLRLFPHRMISPLAKLQYRQTVLPIALTIYTYIMFTQRNSCHGERENLRTVMSMFQVIFHGKHVSVLFPAALNPIFWCNKFVNIPTMWPRHYWDEIDRLQYSIHQLFSAVKCFIIQAAGAGMMERVLEQKAATLCSSNILLLHTPDYISRELLILCQSVTEITGPKINFFPVRCHWAV